MPKLTVEIMRGTGKARDNKEKVLSDGRIIKPGNEVDDAYNGIIAGIRACGDDIVMNRSRKENPQLPTQKYAIQFGHGRRFYDDKKHSIQNFRYSVIEHQKKRGGFAFGFDGAFFKSHGIYNYWRFGLNSPLADGIFLNENSPSDRWEKFRKEFNIPYNPYSLKGKHILICTQPDAGYSMNRVVTVDLLREWIPKIQSQTDLPIIIKPHPNGMKNLVAAEQITGYVKTLQNVTIADPQDDIIPLIQKAARMVTWNSTVAVDSVTMGVPTYSFHRMGFAYPVTDHELNIKNPTFFDRDQWLADINYAVWTPQELATGELWERFKKYCSDKEQGLI